jgi:hypothetical protein
MNFMGYSARSNFCKWRVVLWNIKTISSFLFQDNTMDDSHSLLWHSRHTNHNTTDMVHTTISATFVKKNFIIFSQVYRNSYYIKQIPSVILKKSSVIIWIHSAIKEWLSSIVLSWNKKEEIVLIFHNTTRHLQKFYLAEYPIKFILRGYR